MIEQQIKRDMVIVGGGIAGLWCWHQLHRQGYKPLLIEGNALGAGQTLASQGMIHGGQKYTLEGVASQHAEDLRDMPQIWEDCMKGQGVVDLSGVQKLASQQHLFATSGLGKFATFAAGKSMRARVERLAKDEWPDVFRHHPKFSGKIYALPESVLDGKSLVSSLFQPYAAASLAGRVEDLELSPDGALAAVLGENAQGSFRVEAQAFLFTSGLFNEKVVQKLQLDRDGPKTQRRPLTQVMVRGMPYAFFGHGLTLDPRPRVTITSHPDPRGSGYVWYLGGLVAEKGASQSAEEAIEFGRSELMNLFPHLPWNEAEWGAYPIDRAEAFVKSGFLKSGPQSMVAGNAMLAWPSKLTFAPLLGRKVVDWVEGLGISPVDEAQDQAWTRCEVGVYPWEQVTWHRY